MSAQLAAGTYRCRDVSKSVAAAVRAGVTWIDTAPNYGSGSAEAALRQVLNACPEVQVSTKVGFVPDSDRRAARDVGALRHGLERGHCLARPYISWQLARSRARLGRVPDLVFVHNPEHGRTDRAAVSRTLAGTFEELESAADAGKIGGYGVATWAGLSSGMFTVPGLMKLATTAGGPHHHFRAVQFPVSLIHLAVVADALDGHGALAQAQEAGLDVFASAPLGGGELLGAMTEELVRLIDSEASQAQAALLVALSAPGVSRVLLSASTTAHWADARGAAARESLPPDRLRRVADVLGT
ncbi:aldo/keto reductase [Streptomyces coelicoflavus]|uniref:aldo/keto reductase n=1 Tax=Streptomyces TaxID=1883 RepID=UPI00129135B3|nr:MULTISPECIES: aldo/keto reductase [Streptomyces]MCX5036972.1 aldo/keto reductase [Streptomyces coelicoflavus]QFX83157.1 aldo/keto reductase [Streptomyces sp. SYP-A7193]